jgi:hypothetical protein
MPFDNILEYVEGPTGLNWTLLPVQRFILKLHYGIELDHSERRIPIYNQLQERVRYHLTELSYLDYLFGEGRCNIQDESTLPRRGLILAAGRRTGKTLLAEMIAGYSIVQLLQTRDPHALFQMNPNSMLSVACIVLSNGMRRDITNQINSQVNTVPELMRSRARRDQTSITFRTQAYEIQEGDRGNLVLSVLNQNPRLHTPTIASLILDELANMRNEQSIFDSAIPILQPQSRYVILSTPRSTESAFARLFRYSMAQSTPGDPLALRIPTWEMRPNLGDALREAFTHDTSHFYTDYGAEFQPSRTSRRDVHITVTI